MSAAVIRGALGKRAPLSAELLSGYKLQWSCCWLPGPPHWETLPDSDASAEERGAGMESESAGVLDPAVI